MALSFRINHKSNSLQPSIHAGPFLEVTRAHPDILTYTTFPVYETEADMIEWYNKDMVPSPGECIYAIINKTRSSSDETSQGKFAGIVSLAKTSPINASTDIGAIVFPDFQRTHVTSNAVGQLLLYLLELPSAGGLGLRRVEWQCHAGNEASRRFALRMGFHLEGIARWQRVVEFGRPALSVDALERRNGTTGELPGRHTAIFSIVWDEWDEKRKIVIAQMERRK